jgi:hypothetical protein
LKCFCWLEWLTNSFLSDLPRNSLPTLLSSSSKEMSGFFGSTQVPAALRRCAARINGMPCGQVCESPLSLYCNEHIPGFVAFPQQQQTY